MFTVSAVQVVLVSQVSLLPSFHLMKWVIYKIIENLTKKRMKGLKPASAEEAFQAKKQVALKKIERDFADEAIRGNFEKFSKDARKISS